MGIDIRELRKEQGGDPDKVRDSQKKRFQKPEVVDQVIELDEKWRQLEFNLNRANQEKNNLNKDIGKRKKENKDDPCEDILEKRNELDKTCEQLKIEVQNVVLQRDSLLNTIGNLVHESCVIHNNEDYNGVVSTWGEPRKIEITQKPGACYHHQVLFMIDGYDPKAGSKVAGTRGYYLKNYGYLLCQALQTYSMNFLIERGYTAIQPPFFMKQEIMAETCQLSDFDDQLYKVIGKVGTIGGPQQGQQVLKEEKQIEKEDKEYYLIATSEQPISALHRKERLEFKEGEMIKYAGFSTCFRKEAGKYGKETWGTFRVHQFEKVEQFVICRHEDSWDQHEKMTEIAKEFLQSLELPYRVVNIVSGALNDAASKKYDIEAWFPGYGEFKELMSISNCTDFQSRALDIKLGFQQKNSKDTKQNENKYVHMLNGTLCAVQRTLCCILENYQTEEGLRIPKVLQPYLGGKDFIKYVKNIPKQADME